MNTLTKDVAVTMAPPWVALTPSGVANATVDFDTRLVLTSIAMDVVLEGEAMEARQEAADAIAEVPAPSILPELPWMAPNPVLAAAADYIHNHGWIQGELFDTSGAVCAMGAIRRVTGPDSAAASLAIQTLLHRIAEDAGRALSVPNWNDSEGQTVEAVTWLMY